MSLDNYASYEQFMSHPGMMARVEGVTTETQLLFVELIQHTFAIKDMAERGFLDMATFGSNELSTMLGRLDQEKAYLVIAFMLDQMVEQIHARLAPDGTLRDVHALAKRGAPLFVGSLAGWTFKQEEEPDGV